jgi:adenylate cyclase
MLVEYRIGGGESASFATEHESIVVGRAAEGVRVDLDLGADDNVSRRHARITCRAGKCWVEDLGSRGGTWLNGNAISRADLTADQELVIGHTQLRVRWEREPALSGAAGAKAVAGLEGYVEATVDATLPPFRRVDGEGRSQISLFYELTEALSSAAGDQVLDVLCRHLRTALPQVDTGAALDFTESGQLLLKTHWPAGASLVSTSWARRAAETRQAFIWSLDGVDGDQTLDAPKSVVEAIQRGHRSALYAPMLLQGQARGVIFVGSDTAGAFDNTDLDLLRAAGNQAQLQLEMLRSASLRASLMRQFSPKIADRFIKLGSPPRLGGQRVEPVTVLMADVRGFTALSKQLDAADVVRMLNELFSRFIPIVFQYDGTVDKYIGDAVLAVFGSPDPDDGQWLKAVQAAVAMQAAAAELGNMRVGIGVHSGEGLHGFIGSEQFMEYTVMGSTVNLAARFCDAAAPGEVLISQQVYERVFSNVRVEARKIQTKHADTEGELVGYSVVGWR